MRKFKRSICSTCYFAADCSLTHNKYNISSCSEYIHRLDAESIWGDNLLAAIAQPVLSRC